MDRCQFSEFSFGYCVTEDLAIQGAPLTVAPIFPSLIQEGQAGVGYDVLLDRPGAPLFLQFKLVEQMVRGNANEARLGHFSPPFYRMHLRSSAISDQHESLISLEENGNEVFYVAPGFHTTSALNDAYVDRQVWNRSFRIRPSMIGALPNDRAHHVTFEQTTGQWRFYSEDPSREGRGLYTDEISDSLLRSIRDRGRRNLRQQVEELDSTLMGIVSRRNVERAVREQLDTHKLIEVANPLRRVAYIARQFFDCQLLFATEP